MHARPNDGFGCQVCGECTLALPHLACNCEHDPRRPAPKPDALADELRVTNGLLRELIEELRGVA